MSFPFFCWLPWWWQNDCNFFSCCISVLYHPVEKRLSVLPTIKKNSILNSDLTNFGYIWGEAGGIYNVLGWSCPFASFRRGGSCRPIYKPGPNRCLNNSNHLVLSGMKGGNWSCNASLLVGFQAPWWMGRSLGSSWVALEAHLIFLCWTWSCKARWKPQLVHDLIFLWGKIVWRQGYSF